MRIFLFHSVGLKSKHKQLNSIPSNTYKDVNILKRLKKIQQITIMKYWDYHKQNLCMFEKDENINEYVKLWTRKFFDLGSHVLKQYTYFHFFISYEIWLCSNINFLTWSKAGVSVVVFIPEPIGHFNIFELRCYDTSKSRSSGSSYGDFFW